MRYEPLELKLNWNRIRLDIIGKLKRKKERERIVISIFVSYSSYKPDLRDLSVLSFSF